MSEIARKLKISLLILAGLFVFGALGFHLLGGRTLFESFYISVVILTTVGLKESEPALSMTEQAWSIVLMLAGIGTVLYTTGTVVAVLIDGRLHELFGRRKLMSTISHLQNHFVVVGFGRMGRSICMNLHYKDIPFVLIEQDEHAIQKADELGYLYLHGDAMHEEVLMAAGIDRARGLASCLPNDAANVFVTLTARGVGEQLTIIARAEEARTEEKLRRAGADRVICLPVIGASRVTDLLLNPTVDELLELDGNWPDLEVSKLSVHRHHQAAGKTIAELPQLVENGIVVVAVVEPDGRRHCNPPTDLRLGERDELVLVGPTGSSRRLVECLDSAEAA